MIQILMNQVLFFLGGFLAGGMLMERIYKWKLRKRDEMIERELDKMEQRFNEVDASFEDMDAYFKEMNDKNKQIVTKFKDKI
jgi:hypothetical protein